MALTTTPDAIPTPAASDNFALVTDLLATADRTQAVLTTKANYGVGTTTERNAALSRFPDGAKWYDTTLSVEYRRVAGAWVVPSLAAGVPFAMAAGVATVPPGAGVVVTFPTGRFTTAPIIALGPAWVTASGATGNAVSIQYSGATATQVTLESDGANTVGTNWIAVQMTSTTAAG